LLLAGHITTTLLLGNAVRTFDEHPGVWDELRTDPSLIPGAVEEVLRYRSPFTQVGRSTLHPAELGGVTIPADALVTPWLLSANRDAQSLFLNLFSEAFAGDADHAPADHGFVMLG
jgi:erythromycin 12 hydroxylase